MEKFFRNKLDVALWVAALVLSVALFIYFFAAVRFLAQTTNAALDQNLIKQSEIVSFNLAKAREIRRPGR